MKRILLISSLTFLFIYAGPGHSACECACVNGEVVALCESSIDLEPICSPRICPITPPSIRPIERPRVPPIGTSDCRNEQVYNEYTNRYEWKEVCY